VGDDGFGITLNFGDAPEPLFIPYDAIRTFVDPSVEFGLRFETQESTEDDEVDDDDGGDGSDPSTHDGGEVVSLDKFRK
jgi:hypothetical protein